MELVWPSVEATNVKSGSLGNLNGIHAGSCTGGLSRYRPREIFPKNPSSFSKDVAYQLDGRSGNKSRACWYKGGPLLVYLGAVVEFIASIKFHRAL